MFNSTDAHNRTGWVNLDNARCIQEFHRQLVTEWSELILIANTPTNATLLSRLPQYTVVMPASNSYAAYSWMYPEFLAKTLPLPDTNNWVLLDILYYGTNSTSNGIA